LVESTGEFALRLRSLREAQGLSLRALASLIGVSSVTVWKWEKGDSKPRARLIAPLAKALDVSPLRLQSPGKDAEKPSMSGEGRVLVEPAAIGQADAGREPSVSEASGADEGLPDVIARAKQMIAEASGTGSNNITILIEY
jgi:transcriptional regulator with XRE-family HTH domain